MEEVEVPVVEGKGEGSNMQKTSSEHTLIHNTGPERIQEQPTHSILHGSIYSDSFSATRLSPPPQESERKPSEGQTISYRTKPLNPSTTNAARFTPPNLQLVSVQLTGSTKCFPNRRSPPFQRTGWQYQSPNYGTLSLCCCATSCRQHQR